MIALVTGGRDYAAPVLHRTGARNPLYEVQKQELFTTMCRALLVLQFEAIVHGAAPGTDTAADDWAEHFGVPCHRVPKQRGEHGFLRNIRMHQLWQPGVVLAHPGQRGTRHMCEYAESQGTRVVQMHTFTREPELRLL